MYVTDGPSKIACTEGSNIAQPPGSPGWVDDPTGSVAGDPTHAVSHLLMPLYLTGIRSTLPSQLPEATRGTALLAISSLHRKKVLLQQRIQSQEALHGRQS